MVSWGKKTWNEFPSPLFWPSPTLAAVGIWHFQMKIWKEFFFLLGIHSFTPPVAFPLGVVVRGGGGKVIYF